ncbi:sulfatase-like hydrolase/transferase [Isosphaeraceae bacterium EP7]
MTTVSEPKAECRAEASRILARAAWFGLVAGLGEVTTLTIQHVSSTSSTLGALQMNRHFIWMIPATHLAVALVVTVPFLAASFRWPAAARIGSIRTLLALTLGSLLLLVAGLHAGAVAVLTLGIAFRVAPMIERRADGFARVVRYTLPALFLIFAGLGAVSYHRTTLAEKRALAALPQASADAPNVLLLVLDTVRADRLSLHGADRETTPNLARLAEQGVTFNEARSAAPWTYPSHASLFTGRWPRELRIADERPLDSTFPTMAEYLGAHGYATAGFIANTYYCNSWFGLNRGFAHYEDYYEANVVVSIDESLRCSAIGRRIIKAVCTLDGSRPGAHFETKDAAHINHSFLSWLDKPRPKGAPFFAFLNYMDAHDPYSAEREDGKHFGAVPESPEEEEFVRAWHLAPKKVLNPRQVDLVRDRYDDCIHSLDEQLGHLLDDLKTRGLMEKTLIVVTSDHGEGFGEHGLFLHGHSVYSQETHVPLLIVGPGVQPRNLDVDQPVSTRDVAATVVDRLKIADGSPFPGRSLARFWDAGAISPGQPEEPIFSEGMVRTKIAKNPNRPPAQRGPLASVIVDRLHYIRDAHGREELYDITVDPHEEVNLVDDAVHRTALERGRVTLEQFGGSDVNRR